MSQRHWRPIWFTLTDCNIVVPAGDDLIGLERVLGDMKRRRVAETAIGPLWVSTVFLAIDYQFGDGDPLVFETMVFDGRHSGNNLSVRRYSMSVRRYSTWADAERGHAETVALVGQEVAGVTGDVDAALERIRAHKERPS